MIIILKSLVYFILAGLAEIGGGYLIWLWLRESKSLWLGVIGGIILVSYGIIPALQASPNFGRIYAAYGGVFVVMSILWGWKIDSKIPDNYDLIDATICLVGIAIIMYAPRSV